MGPEAIADHPVPGMHIWGWMSPAELEWLGAQAAQLGSVAEVGSLHGRSAFALLTACEGPVWCVDPWDDEHDLCEASFMSNCGRFPNLRPVRGYSPQAAARVPDVDMVFIDGWHSYEAVMADIEAWTPKAKKLICGHDYHQGPDAGYPDVARAVDEVFGNRVTVAEGTAIWAVEL
jgi:hypothetical protein